MRREPASLDRYKLAAQKRVLLFPLPKSDTRTEEMHPQAGDVSTPEAFLAATI